MRFLIAQNLDESLAKRLRREGHSAQHTQDLGMARSPDADLFAWCRSNDTILVTADKKLTKYLAGQRATSPTVVILRDYSLDYAQVETDLVASLSAIADVLRTQGPAVFSIIRNHPTRFQPLLLIAEA